MTKTHSVSSYGDFFSMHSKHHIGFLFIIVSSLLINTGCQTMQAAWKKEISLKYVSKIAESLSQKPYKGNWGELPKQLSELTYDDYRKIEYNPKHALWANESDQFNIRFFHPGSIYNRAVQINEFTDSHVQQIRFVSEFFNYQKIPELKGSISSSLGYAGFSIYSTSLEQDGKFSEFAVFLGSNYFRVIGENQHWGLSARALAINTGTGSEEEFPEFREFWIQKPHPDTKQVRILALLDSPSAAGAYEFILSPDIDSKIRVRSEIYFRNQVERIGFAPVSSMYFFGENTLKKPEDFRPEVHDSDGLLLAFEDKIEWRPLANPAAYRSQEIENKIILGYGLMQRDQDFDNYQDIEAQYHRRPSVWINPIAMPEGQLLLHEFNTPNEYNDNVSLMWVPDGPVKVGTPYSCEYELSFTQETHLDKGIVSATRIGKTHYKNKEVYQVVIDFSGESIESLDMSESIQASVKTGSGIELLESVLMKNPFNQGWRLTLLLDIPQGHYGSEIEAVILQDNEAITENWFYQWIE